MVRGLTFDLWQTLFYEPEESERRDLRARRLAEVLARLGQPREPEEIAGLLARCEALHGTADLDREFTPLEQLDWVLGSLGLKPGADRDVALTSSCPDLVWAYCESALAMPPEVFPAARGVLSKLAASYPLALISNTGATPGTVLRTLLYRFGLLGHFRALVFSDELGHKKPSPVAFQAALQGLGLMPAEVVHIGDNPLTDVHGAKRLGMRAVLLAGGWHSSRRYRHPQEKKALAPDAVAAGLEELPAAIERLARERP